MNIKKFWNEAVSFEEYLKKAEESLSHPKTDVEKEYREYYELGIQRMHRMSKIYKPDTKQAAALALKNFNGKILIISEPWCGDASQAIPVVYRFFRKIEIRITYRDQQPSLIDDFLTNGARSIPIVVFLDEKFQVINSWGPRPEFGKKLFLKHKENPALFSEEQLHNDLQVYYAKNKGFDTVEEMLALL